MIRFFYHIFLVIFFIGNQGVCQPKIDKEINYISDLAFNLRGGKETGYSWLGCFQASLTFDTQALNLWKNGKIKFTYISTHGKSFSDLTGDLQIASNIEADQLSTTFELWYKHQVGKFEATAGLIDVNSIFCYSEAALSLINSSFGIQPTISSNNSVSIYPISSLGISLKVKISERTSVRFGVFDGRPALYGNFQPLPDLSWNQKEGTFFISEVERQHHIGNLSGSVKGGCWTHTQKVNSHQKGQYSSNTGFYLIGQQEFIKRELRNLSIWGKFGGAPQDCNIIQFFNEFGFSYTNSSNHNLLDLLSIGFGQAIFCPGFRKIQALNFSETVLELSAQKEFDFLTVQPDIQYIINPSGLTEIDNPICFILRAVISL